MNGASAQWQQFRAALISWKDGPTARFVLNAGANGTVWFDMVSLFTAKTFRNRPNGLRDDLAQTIADLKPSFIRFPGGCVNEGGMIPTAYNWKNTVGLLPDRTEIQPSWNYRETSGMVFNETLQFCKDLCAEPLHVGFAGDTCVFRGVEDLPMSRIEWVASTCVCRCAMIIAEFDAQPVATGARPGNGRNRL